MMEPIISENTSGSAVVEEKHAGKRALVPSTTTTTGGGGDTKRAKTSFPDGPVYLLILNFVSLGDEYCYVTIPEACLSKEDRRSIKGCVGCCIGLEKPERNDITYHIRRCAIAHSNSDGDVVKRLVKMPDGRELYIRVESGPYKSSGGRVPCFVGHGSIDIGW
jgi:hypothetical protein